jgi:hypothetical protein
MFKHVIYKKRQVDDERHTITLTYLTCTNAFDGRLKNGTSKSKLYTKVNIIPIQIYSMTFETNIYI